MPGHKAGGSEARDPDTSNTESRPHKSDDGGKRKKRRGCCQGRNFAIWMAGLSIAIGIYNQQDYISNEIVPALDPYVEKARDVLPEAITERISLLHKNASEGLRPGRELREQGFKPKHPVVIVPGFVTSGLLLWEGKPCAKKYFRERIWGSVGMTRSFFNDVRCWMDHMRLDNDTGIDPPGIKLRAAEGLEAVDYFMPGYHVWAKVIEALADVGYDTNNLIGETYDWRLGVPNLEVRDGYFTRLKHRIEITHHLNHEKVFVMSHSWGDNVFRNFLAWVGEDDEAWAEKHIAHYSNIAGPTLGVPKSISIFLSGETRDTAELPYVATMMTDAAIPRNERVRLFRTWGAGVGMLPVGGPDIWGNTTWAPDDTEDMRDTNATYGAFITEYRINQTTAERAQKEHSSMAETVTRMLGKASQAEVEETTRQHDIVGALKILIKEAGKAFEKRVHLFGAVYTDKAKRCVCKAGSWDKYYFNPLKCPLPKAPTLKLYCMYGVGMPTERAYSYINMEQPENLDRVKGEGRMERQREVLWKMNNVVHEPNGTLEYGVRKSDGDGTVPLISSGALCRKHWRHKELNPSGLEVVSREYVHAPRKLNMFDMRGGGKSANHVDILSHVDVLHDLVMIATGHGGELGDSIHSNIDDIVAAIPLDAD